MKKLALCAIIILLSFCAGAENYYNKTYYYSIDLAPGFTVLDSADEYNMMFQHKSAEAFFEVTVFDLDAASTNAEMFEDIQTRFEAEGSYAAAKFCQFDAVRGSLTLTLEDVPLVMDMVSFKDKYFYYVIMGYSVSSSYKKYKSTLASMSQSFKIHYDNVTYGNDTVVATKKEEPDNKKIDKKNAELDKGANKYDELRPAWDRYKPIIQFLKADFIKARNELTDISSSDSWARYDVDPYGPDANKNFWHKFYLDMFKKNYYRVNSAVEWFKEKSKSEGWSSFDLAMEIIKALQSIPYGSPEKVADADSKGSKELGFFTPNEVAHYNTGDCDTKSLFIVILLKRFGYDAVMYYSEVYAHAMVGLNINATGYNKTYNGKKYYFVESTYPGWQIGQISDEWNDMNNWYLLPIN